MRYNSAGARLCDDRNVWSKENGINGHFIVGTYLTHHFRLMKVKKCCVVSIAQILALMNTLSQ